MFLTCSRIRRPLFIGCLAALVAHAASGATVVGPAETFPDPDRWRSWIAEATAGRVDIGWLRDALADHGGDLIASPDGGLASLHQAIAELPAVVRSTVAEACEANFAAEARRALDDVRARADFSPADACAVAARYPLTSVATAARAVAAERALDRGDVSAARALATPGDGASTRLVKLPVAPVPFAPPFAADWYAKLNNFGEPRVVPIRSGDVTFTTNDRGTSAYGPDGHQRWTWAAPTTTVTPLVTAGTGRGPLCVPAVLADDAGHPQLLVVRVGVGLTALRASDGRLFWTTAGDPAWAGLTVLGPPTVDGRLVTAVALSVTDADAGSLVLVAVDVTDGRPMWRATLGAVTDPVNLFGGHHVRLAAPEPFRDAPPPTVTGDLLIAPTNAGEVVAVDRFSGEVRWVRPYPPAMVAGKDAVQLGKMVILPPLPRAAVLRWTAPAVVCGDVVWIAPQDAADAWGLDRSTGQVRWRTASLPDDATCVGVVDGRFVIAGQAVTFVDPATGAADETWTPPRGAALTGPPTVVSGQISVTSTAGVLHPARQASGG